MKNGIANMRMWGCWIRLFLVFLRVFCFAEGVTKFFSVVAIFSALSPLDNDFLIRRVDTDDNIDVAFFTTSGRTTVEDFSFQFQVCDLRKQKRTFVVSARLKALLDV